MITHASNPNLYPMNAPTPPVMAAAIQEVDGPRRRTVLSVGLNGELFGSVGDAITILENGTTPLEGDVATAFLGFLMAIKKARETK